MAKLKFEKVTKSYRFDYQSVHQEIENAILQHLKQRKVLPTQGQLAETLGLSRKTICLHLKEINLQNFMPNYKSLSPRVMLGLLSKALTGNPLAVKLWMQIVEGFSEKTTSVLTDPDGRGIFENYKDLTDDELEAEIEKRNTPVSNSKA